MSKRIDAILTRPEPGLVAQVERFVREAVNLVSDGRDGSMPVTEINRLTGRNYTDRDFFELWGWISDEEFALAASFPRSEPIDDLSRDELLEIVGYFSRAEQPQTTVLLDFMERSFPGVFDTDLIYHPHRDMNDEETVDELLHRQELFREGGPDALKTYLVRLAQEVLNDPNAKVYSKMWARSVASRG